MIVGKRNNKKETILPRSWLDVFPIKESPFESILSITLQVSSLTRFRSLEYDTNRSTED